MNIKNIFLTALFSFLMVFVVGQTPVHATASGNIFGNLWSSNIGWISFNNCTDATTCSGIDYGVTMDKDTGTLSGQAYSNNIGWISFDGASVAGCNSSVCTPSVNWNADKTSATISGWARACSVFISGCSGVLKSSSTLGGWDGFINLSGLMVDSSGTFIGSSWGYEVFGWLKPIGLSVSIVNSCPPVTPMTPGYCTGGTVIPLKDVKGCVTGYDCTCLPSYVFDPITKNCTNICPPVPPLLHSYCSNGNLVENKDAKGCITSFGCDCGTSSVFDPVTTKCIASDFCPNIDGVQTSPLPSYLTKTSGSCACVDPNATLDTSTGLCNVTVDLCSNVDGNQGTLASDVTADANGVCKCINASKKIDTKTGKCISKYTYTEN
jgi:hypothetical protein